MSQFSGELVRERGEESIEKRERDRGAADPDKELTNDLYPGGHGGTAALERTIECRKELRLADRKGNRCAR